MVGNGEEGSHCPDHGQTSRGQDALPGRGNSMCAERKTYKKEKCGVLSCQNLLHSDCQRGARAQSWCFRPASCSSLSSCSSLQVPCTHSGQSTVPGVGPKCGIDAVAWVGEKDFVISYRHKDLCGWCYSRGEGKAAGKRAATGGLWENLGLADLGHLLT